MARAKKGASGEAADAPAQHEAPAMHDYLIRRRVGLTGVAGVVVPDTAEAVSAAWIELGTVSAPRAGKALEVYGEAHAEELAALEGEIVLEAVSVRFRLERRATPRRQLAIDWGDA
jgi:hypothetical protein